MRYLITGGAGFIGSHLSEALLARGDQVVCIDNFNDYYDPVRKRRNIARALAHPGYTLVEADFRDAEIMDRVFAQYRPQRVAHIGAMAGPRPSMRNPALYEEVNVRGTLTILETAARYEVEGLVLASTSSVYGMSPTPWSEESPTDRPLSYYAATKKAAEVLAYTAHRQYGMPIRIVRFFTVYGPRGRPDMTPHLFVDAMVAGKSITLFNGGMGVYRDWTYVDDIVSGVVAALDAGYAFDIFNLGHSSPVQLIDFVTALERVTGLCARIVAQPLPAADPPITYARIDKATRMLGFQPCTPLEEGLARFWEWYRSEHGA
ncbi:MULTISPECIES: NAD-dependent epimerase/dehydratase family protein [Roseiflexus]|jgi:UDP-glucuronate 4-epimerase|uniref:NAD-dependent epimerase/dehydratase n=1 Tax=Roseiflexus castenholzii (strain DSM 13941 / HLO8) TaxID=383372 RepID=A7NRV0_ROSCS|nr:MULTISPECIES: NAD-dependent epimerase/dehydratase family protein [Roseiflexus]ABU60296.1 NAD-dependent epimerase/dehydratase [Roseiflexus castenholzii DSM 13941]GIV98667.1 MAG: epimerase [Roseiflexus sp.]